MSTTDARWQSRVDDLWARFDDYDPEAFVAELERVTAEGADDVPRAVVEFERAGGFDSVGRTEEAVPLYRAALAAGSDGGEPALDAWRRRQATVQLASSLRALGRAEEAVALLEAEAAHPIAGDDENAREAGKLQDAVLAFLALALADTGREREAVGVALGALAPHVPRYRRSLTNYAAALRGPAD
ncbi:tetratricopeptide repeat protein [Herbiconiux sp. VKM Ac-1786]|uniref:tetratricopeptide repeat protein n=1 Tax=Herbiconiux sp. VKM Ac-1786 TaxID=2783824 RepID=UPI001889DA0C|nr:tetratricopeptide repeat protein [Herbiconiux sp. VKM Ac-1786]MBF4571754.1 tetratricopeptide repeat protein [Herbiconiux sp. VKM Ac-1786]